MGVSTRLPADQLSDISGDRKNNFGSLWGSLELRTGDIIGVCHGHSEYPMLAFFLNSMPLDDRSVSKVKGTLYPCVCVRDGAEVEFIFDNFVKKPPHSKFKAIMAAREILNPRLKT